MNARNAMGAALIVWTICSIAILLIGEMPMAQALQGIWEGAPGWNPLRDERLPRMIVVGCTGASLAVAGAVTQSLFRNPLATPSVLGLPFGGSFCVVCAFAMGWNVTYPFSIPIAAFCGCIATLFIVTLCSRRRGETEMMTLILNGIAVSMVIMTAQKTLLYMLRDQWSLIQAVTEWEAGSTADRTWNHVHMQLPLTIIGLWVAMRYRSELNILALGEEEAHHLGVEVRRVRWHLFFAAALLTGGAIAAVGLIAFFGLLMPHMFRSLLGPNNEKLLPVCAVGGAALLALMETVLRLTHTHLFTIGNVSALLGAVFFLLLLLGEEKRRWAW
jgi:iron complex transport system permease protein